MPGMEAPGAGPDGDQQGVAHIAELLAGDVFQLADVLHDLGLDLIVDGAVIGIVLGAGLGGDGKTAGTGIPRLVISARLAPLPPRSSRILPFPSENR